RFLQTVSGLVGRPHLIANIHKSKETADETPTTLVSCKHYGRNASNCSRNSGANARRDYFTTTSPGRGFSSRQYANGNYFTYFRCLGNWRYAVWGCGGD
ncbi:MAG TPA: hypothetical protein VM095_10920, partial [Pyrinomonadaceae bacterium]|nr:hypothetical protein [Pyrinomonadaceae bacterium]